MLKLTRRAFEDESVFILDEKTGKAIAKLQVVKISGSQVSLGITAPQGIKIMRSELLSESVIADAEKQLN